MLIFLTNDLYKTSVNLFNKWSLQVLIYLTNDLYKCKSI